MDHRNSYIDVAPKKLDSETWIFTDVREDLHILMLPSFLKLW